MGKYFDKLIHLDKFEKSMKKNEEKSRNTLEMIKDGYGETVFTSIMFAALFIVINKFHDLLSAELNNTMVITLYLITIFFGIFFVALFFFEKRMEKKVEKLVFISKKRKKLALNRKIKYINAQLEHIYKEISDSDIQTEYEDVDKLVELVLTIKKKKILGEESFKEEEEMSKNQKLLKEVELLEKDRIYVKTY